MALAGSAHAASFQNWNDKVETCAGHGDTADLYYRMSQQGQRPTRHDPAWSEPMPQHI